VYKRGHGTAVVRPAVDVAAPGELVMPASASANANAQAEVEYARLQAIRRLLFPFPLSEDATRAATRRYWAHVLPDGRSVIALGRDEAAALAAGAKTPGVARRASELLAALEAGEPARVPIEYQ
jgi:hypothetical protein